MDNLLLRVATKRRESPERVLSSLCWRLHANTDETVEEGLEALAHHCPTEGHILVSDWDRDLDWNQHYILIPKRCRVCSLKLYEARKATSRKKFT